MFDVYAQIRYRRIEQIGVGEGMNSLVFRAFDPYLNREIAVKEIDKSKFGNDFDAYCNEARTMFAAVHPNIVPIEYVCETPDQICLALPYFCKGSLKARIAHGPLELRQLLTVSQRILVGVGKIHTNRLLHLDLKPSNILFDDVDAPLVADFGQSRKLEPNGMVHFPSMYKWFTPPEVWINHAASVESDIYQLGALLYSCANGEPVYQLQRAKITSNSELQAAIARGRFPDTRFFLPHVPKRIRTIIRKATRVQPAQRYHSAFELAAALGRVPPPLNWKATPLGDGAYNWRVARPGSADLEIELTMQNASGWQTKVWTTRGQERRAKGLADYWQEGLRYDQACDHLTDVFADLGQ